MCLYGEMCVLGERDRFACVSVCIEMIGGCSRNFKAWSAEQWWGHVRVCVCVIQDTSQRDAAGFGDGLKW